MDKFSRKEKEFKDVIEQQKEQLGRYEKKLRGKVILCTQKHPHVFFLLLGCKEFQASLQCHNVFKILKTFLDVVQAYKGIQKEKEALEASLKALTETSRSSSDTRDITSENSSVDDKANEETSQNESTTSEV